MSKTSKSHSPYQFSIPERKEILKYLEKAGRPCSLKHIARDLKMKNQAQRGALSNRLRAMVRDGQLIRNRRDGYGLIEKMDLIAGKIVGHADGYGFVIPDSGEGGDLYLSTKEMRSVFHGDRVAVRVAGVDRKGRREGALVEVLEHVNTQVVGRYFEKGKIGFVVPDNKRMNHDIIVPLEDGGKAEAGDFVLVELVSQPDRHTQPVGKVAEVLGNHEQSGMATEIAIRAFDLPFIWPEEVEEEIAEINPEAELDVSDRLDLRNLPFVTIDGADARDFDDAVYCEKQGVGWRLFVAVADVSHYVQPGSALDDEALNRGTSVYFPNRVIPMLPEILSNELCSLKPEVDRLCLVCEMHLNNKGTVKRYEFHNAVMCSAARLTYEDMSGIVVDANTKLRDKHKNLLGALDELYQLFILMHKNREKQGLLDFDSTESEMIFDDKGAVQSIQPLLRNDAHRLIEEFMLAANVAAAEYLLEKAIPILFRNHDTPKQEKLTNLRELLGELGLTLTGGEDPDATDYAKLIKLISKREDAHMIKTVLLRSLPLAVYSSENLGHFGLAFDAYTHFTSPIRRYPDLLVHRAIRHLIANKKPSSFIYTHDQMHSLGVHSSMTERRAEEASRDVLQRMKCEYMRDKVGEVFEGTISSVTSFGLFVELDDVFVEGLVHVTALPVDYYHYNAIGHRLSGERTGDSYSLGGRVKVQVVRVSVDDKKIDFELVK